MLEFQYLSATLACLCCSLAVASCGDPVPDGAVAALGPEDPTVPPGPSHRPGQPCVVCHQVGGKASAFGLAGTVYADATSRKPLGGVSVIILDAANAEYTSSTNCAGNFYIRPEQFTPAYPIWVTLRAGRVQRDMASPAYREGSCAACHTDPTGPASAGHVYLIDDPTTQTAPPSNCH
jgi:hypothetical protein